MRSGGIVLVVLLLVLVQCQWGCGALVPAFFIFGDSLVDVGNNNYLLTLAKANIPPYGIDFPRGATGRFSNGKTVMDVVCDLIDLPYVPPYLDPNTRNARILKGVNYASGGGGILHETGRNYIQRISMSQQLYQFRKTLTSLVQQLGNVTTQQLLSESLFAVVVGSNDFLSNYFLSGSRTRSRYTPQQFQALVLTTYSQQLMELYMLGARRIVVTSIGPLGCIPSQVATNSSNVDGLCIESVNDQVVNFNAGLHQMLARLNSQLPEAQFVYVDVYTPVAKIVSNPAAYGMRIVNRGCCGAGRFNGQLPCFLRPITSLCSNRSDYLFFDYAHTTEAANLILGNDIYQSFMSSLRF